MSEARTEDRLGRAFRAEHRSLDPARSLAEARQLCDEARAVLRPSWFSRQGGPDDEA
jgi:hypothetical protein